MIGKIFLAHAAQRIRKQFLEGVLGAKQTIFGLIRIGLRNLNLIWHHINLLIWIWKYWKAIFLEVIKSEFLGVTALDKIIGIKIIE